MSELSAPFPYFGGKSRIAPIVWRALGDVENYIEPFFGSGAVLLARPEDHFWWDRTECVNDADGLLSNAWRAIAADPDAVAVHADWPVNENDLHARHAWLVGQKESLRGKLEGSPEFYDARIAGWWIWGACLWIWSGWCAGRGPWHVVDGELVRTGAGGGTKRQLVHIGDDGNGVNRKRVHIGDDGKGDSLCESAHDGIRSWMRALSNRLRRVRVCCGDWERVCGSASVIFPNQGNRGYKNDFVGVFLDPPYTDKAGRCGDIYAEDSLTVGHRVYEWCKVWGAHKSLRIVLCGYEGEYDLPGWTVVPWKAAGGYGRQGKGAGRENATRERLWLSPGCVGVVENQQSLFGGGF